MTEADRPQTTDVSTTQAEYDSPWKEALEVYFEPFLALLFPAVHALIDWSRPYESLEQEFQQLAKDAEVGKRFTDKLFKVWRQTGEEAWVLVHIEVQSQEDTGFAERMFVYNYRCFDRYRKPVISLAVLGDDRASWRPNAYGYALGGCRMGLEFPIAKLLDYDAQWQELEASRNPFAIMVMAHLKTKATTGAPQQRKQWKWFLFRRLFEQGYSRDDVVELVRLVDWMMGLPSALEQEFRAELRQYQEERQMPYITSFERLAKEEMLEAILEARFGELDDALRGIVTPVLALSAAEYSQLILGLSQVSREELLARFRTGGTFSFKGDRMPYITSFERLTQVETLQEVILEALSLRFGTLPPGLVDALNQLDDVARLKQLHRGSVTTTSLEEFQSLLSQNAELE